MSIHCSFACFSSRFLRDSTGTLLWRCIVLAGLAAGPEEEGEFCLTLFPSLFVLHALHTLVVGGLTRVHDGHGQPEFPVLEPDKLFHIFFIRRITPMVLKVFMLWLVEEYINLQSLLTFLHWSVKLGQYLVVIQRWPLCREIDGKWFPRTKKPPPCLVFLKLTFDMDVACQFRGLIRETRWLTAKLQNFKDINDLYGWGRGVR